MSLFKAENGQEEIPLELNHLYLSQDSDQGVEAIGHQNQREDCAVPHGCFAADVPHMGGTAGDYKTWEVEMARQQLIEMHTRLAHPQQEAQARHQLPKSRRGK